MIHAAALLSPSEASKQLGVSTKTLRVYERHGLIKPRRTAVGWRVYGPTEMAQAANIVALRALDLSLAQIANILNGDLQRQESTLTSHKAALEEKVRRLTQAAHKIGALCNGVATPKAPMARPIETAISFALPWPWGGEPFELGTIKPITFITGPLGCGKTRLAGRIADTIPGGLFVGLDRASTKKSPKPVHIDKILGSLINNGATESPALSVLLQVLATNEARVLAIDMIEEELDQSTQEALITHLRATATMRLPLFLMTRSTSILDMASMGPDEALIFCPANHSPPFQVQPYPGSIGYEAVTTCLAPPCVRARTKGVIAMRPEVA